MHNFLLTSQKWLNPRLYLFLGRGKGFLFLFMGESGWAQKTAGARKISRKALLSILLKPDPQSINAFGGKSSFAERIVALHISAWPWPRLRKFGENIMLCPCNNPSLQSPLLCPYRKTGCGKYQLNCASRKVPPRVDMH